MTVAALFVEKRGPYSTIPDVELWDEKRDARTYPGPHPVVAHPPCSRWCRLAGLVEARWGHKKGDDGGCFASALASVRRWGGVLEHPAYTDAWAAHGLTPPSWVGWQCCIDGGYVAHVEQGRYGHPAKKATWLYAYGLPLSALPSLDWGRKPDNGSGALVSWCENHTKRDYTPIIHGEKRVGRAFQRQRVGKKAAAATPPPPHIPRSVAIDRERRQYILRKANMSQAYNVPLICTFEAITCCKCGISFAVDGQVRRRWQEKGELFYCPNGHSQHYIETDIQRLKKQLERSEREKTFAQNNAAAERAAREKTERRLSATKGAKTRMANRIKHGVCPCCNRMFQNVLRHMATKHPDFKPTQDSAT